MEDLVINVLRDLKRLVHTFVDTLVFAVSVQTFSVN